MSPAGAGIAARVGSARGALAGAGRFPVPVFAFREPERYTSPMSRTRRPNAPAGRMRLLVPAALAALLGATAPVAAAGPRFEVQAAPLLVLSGDGLAPVLAHGGFSLGAGAELRAGAWIPFRARLGYFHIFPSAISTAGDLYRSFAGWDLAVASGARVLSREGDAPFGLDLLGGVSFGAAKYPGTTVAFATFSADLTFRADFSMSGSGGWRAVLPLSCIFRPGARSFSAGLGAAYVLPPARRAVTSPPGGAE